MQSDRDFESFLDEVVRRLRRALPAAIGIDATPDAIGDAVSWAWEHRERVAAYANPHGYLYRVAVNAGRRPTRGALLPEPSTTELPEVEPALVPALLDLSEMQRQVVWLVQACGWTYAETAEALDISASAVGTHLSRGMTRLRTSIVGETKHA